MPCRARTRMGNPSPVRACERSACPAPGLPLEGSGTPTHQEPTYPGSQENWPRHPFVEPPHEALRGRAFLRKRQTCNIAETAQASLVLMGAAAWAVSVPVAVDS
jgi:hypothetical protein